MAYNDGFLNDEEFLFLYDYYEPVNPSYPYWDFDPFCLDSFNSCECEAHFRVAKDDLPILLQIPATFKCPQGTVYNGRALLNAETISLRMSIFRFNFDIWSSNTRAVYNHKHMQYLTGSLTYMVFV